MSVRRPALRIWGIVPAAGFGRRMGCAKQALPFGDSTVGATVVRTLLAAGLDGVVCVTRRELHDALRLPEDPRLHVALNDHPRCEMIDSIRVGLARLEDLGATSGDGVLVAPGDMPGLTVRACALCADAFRGPTRPRNRRMSATARARIVIAALEGRRGHPIVFSYALRDALARLTDGLRELPRQYPDRVRLVECGDACVTRDVNTPADYEHTLLNRPRGGTRFRSGRCARSRSR